MANLAQFLLAGNAQAVEYNEGLRIGDETDLPYTITPASDQYVCAFINIVGASSGAEFSITSESNDIVDANPDAIDLVFGGGSADQRVRAKNLPLIFGRGEAVTIDISSGDTVTQIDIAYILLED